MEDKHSKRRTDKPWGCYVDYFRSNNVVFKKLLILPSEKLSYQYHENRTEFWYVALGKGLLTLDDCEIDMGVGDFILIRKGEKHMIECVEDGVPVPLVIYEMQCGECSEEDIVRLEDKYGRTEE